MALGYNILDLYGCTFEFCNYEIAIRKTNWWQFRKRKALKDAQWFYYPMMVNELNTLTQPNNPK